MDDPPKAVVTRCWLRKPTFDSKSIPSATNVPSLEAMGDGRGLPMGRSLHYRGEGVGLWT